MTLRRRLEEFRLAVIFLTRLPAGRLSDPLPTLTQAAWAFPIAGLPVGLITALVWLGLNGIGMAPMLAAVLTCAAQAMTTGALHHDGLADVADGLGGGRDRDHALEIMRDSRLGSYGALALALTVFAWVMALGQMPPLAGALALLALAVASRVAMLVLLIALPSAREKGLGQAAGQPCGPSLVPGAALAVILLICLGLIPSLAAGLGVTLAALFLAWRAMKRIGGQTGDVLGATQLLGETAGLLALTVALA